MGFFSRLFGTKGSEQNPDSKRISGAKSSAQSTPEPLEFFPKTPPTYSPDIRDSRQGHFLDAWKDVPVVKTMILPAEQTARVYVYDSSSLKDLAPGTEIELQVFPGQGFMTSTATGSIGATKNMGACLLYERRLIGFSSAIDLKQVLQAHKQGIRIAVTARVGSWLPEYPGIKAVEVRVPNDREFIETAVFKFKSGIPENAASIKYNEWDEKDYEELTMRKSLKFPNAVVEYLPQPEQTRTKPIIEVRSKTGVVISRVSGKNRIYPEMKKAVETGNRFYVTAKPKTSTEYEGYAISIWYWNE